MEEIEPLIEKGKQGLKWCFDQKIKKHQEDIYLRDTLRKSSSHQDHRHKKEIDNERQKSLFLAYSVNIGKQTDAVGQEWNDREEEDKDELADEIEMEFGQNSHHRPKGDKKTTKPKNIKHNLEGITLLLNFHYRQSFTKPRFLLIK